MWLVQKYFIVYVNGGSKNGKNELKVNKLSFKLHSTRGSRAIYEIQISRRINEY